MDKLLKAFEFAQKKHEGQVRKVTGNPYFNHVAMVALIVSNLNVSYSQRESVICAAVLHDILEDTNTTVDELYDEFGYMTTRLVLELTNSKEDIAKSGKMDYMKRKIVGMEKYALTIKLADRLHNISDNPTKTMVEDTLHIISYIRANHPNLKPEHIGLMRSIETKCHETLEIE